MKPIRATAAVLCIGLLLGAGGDSTLPATTRAAKQQYDAALLKADAEYQRQCRVAADRYLADLKVGLKQAMKDEKLDEANKIKAEINSLQNAGVAAKPNDKAARFNGLWDIQWIPGDVVRYQFNSGTVESLLPPPSHFIGKVEIVSQNEVISQLNNGVQRWTLAGDRVFVENWSKKPASGKPDTVAVGVRPK